MSCPMLNVNSQQCLVDQSAHDERRHQASSTQVKDCDVAMQGGASPNKPGIEREQP